MTEARYEVRDQAGTPVAGGELPDDQLKFIAARVDGVIVDTGDGNRVVYDAGPGSGLDPDMA